MGVGAPRPALCLARGGAVHVGGRAGRRARVGETTECRFCGAGADRASLDFLDEQLHFWNRPGELYGLSDITSHCLLSILSLRLSACSRCATMPACFEARK